jgi:hypothetical protein
MDLIQKIPKSTGLSQAIYRATRRKKQRFCSVNITQMKASLQERQRVLH